MKLKEYGFIHKAISLAAGVCLAYSLACHWLGFLSESKINRVSMLLIFGVFFSFLVFQIVKWGTGFLLENLPSTIFYSCLAAALIIAGVLWWILNPSFENPLISSQAEQAGAQTLTARLWLIGLELSDFVNLTVILFLGELAISSTVRNWQTVVRIIPKLFPLFSPLVLILWLSVILNLGLLITTNQGLTNKLTKLPSNSLIGLDEGSRTFRQNIRVYTVFFTYYPGWTLYVSQDLSGKLRLNYDNLLTRWGRIAAIESVSYPYQISEQEVHDLASYKQVNVENGTGLRYIAILEEEPSHKICLRRNGNFIYIIPISLSPVCESR